MRHVIGRINTHQATVYFELDMIDFSLVGLRESVAKLDISLCEEVDVPVFV